MTHSCVPWLIHMWHDSSTCNTSNQLMLCNLTQFLICQVSILCDMHTFSIGHECVASHNVVYVCICDMMHTCDRTDVCDMTHMCYTHVIHVWCHLFAMYVYICDMTHMCGMTHLRALIHTCDMTPVCDMTHMCDMTHECSIYVIPVWHDSMLCGMTQFSIWYECVASCHIWLNPPCDMNVWHDFILCDTTRFLMWHACVTWLNTVWHDSTRYVTWTCSIMPHMTQFCMWHECVTWLNSMWHGPIRAPPKLPEQL